ncbi:MULTISPECIES: hypothetical protein [unclassified Bradyrhizobium]|uniref:hypothetical protein n=1 Tax=unclassified Bradyrhizobium TaxID=2631580 RepID=UPI0028E42B02|nr:MULTISPECIES: hypothetical protein [unclassified Bradyrhizobium]
MLDMLQKLYEELRFAPSKTLEQCYALNEVAYLLGSGNASAGLVRMAIEYLRAAFGK